MEDADKTKNNSLTLTQENITVDEPENFSTKYKYGSHTLQI